MNNKFERTQWLFPATPCSECWIRWAMGRDLQSTCYRILFRLLALLVVCHVNDWNVNAVCRFQIHQPYYTEFWINIYFRLNWHSVVSYINYNTYLVLVLISWVSETNFWFLEFTWINETWVIYYNKGIYAIPFIKYIITSWSGQLRTV